MRRIGTGLALIGLVAVPAATMAGDAAAPGAWSPDTIAWQRAAPNGTRYALLEGDRDRPGGAFTYAFFIPAGVWDGPHRHSTTARVFVARGTLALGYGDVADHTAARRYPAGSVAVVPGGAVHFDGADVDTVLIGVASGPWSTRYRDGSAPASAGTPVR